MSDEYVDFDELARQIGEEPFGEAIGAEHRNGSWRCPLRERHENNDRDPSFDIYRNDGRLWATCHAGTCGYRSGSPVTWAARVWGCGEQEAAVRLARRAGLSHLIERSESNDGSPEGPEICTYRDEGGEPLFRVLRFPNGRFAQQGRQGDGWKNDIDGIRRVPYRLPEVRRAIEDGDPVYVVEGERDVHAVEDEDHVATCNPGGAGNWKEEFNQHFEGGEIRVVADDDPPGREHAREVADQLRSVAESVELLKPAEGNDVENHLDAGRSLDELEHLTKETSDERRR